MLSQTPAAAAVLAGSFTPALMVDAWYNGQLVLADLPVTAANEGEDVTQAILGSGGLTAAAPDDSLIPTSWDSPLACYGSELHVRQGIPLNANETEWYSLGWFPIMDFECNDWWRQITHPDGTTAWASQGTQVTVSLSDRWTLIDQATFALPEQPAQLDSAKTELKRLLSGIVDVADLSAIADVAIPAAISYSGSRTDAVNQLANLLGCTARMSRDGALTLIPIPTSTGPAVWTVTVEDDDEAARILTWSRKGDRAGLYNQFVSTGQSPGGTPVQAVVTTGTGPLAYNGPLGRLPYTSDSQLLTTDTACQADAQANQRRYGGAQTVLIPATVPSNPALETGDVLALALPNGLTLTGPVSSIDRADLRSAVMDVSVAVSRGDLWGTG